MNEDLPTVH